MSFQSAHCPSRRQTNSRKRAGKERKEEMESSSPVSVQNPNSDCIFESKIQTCPNDDPVSKKSKNKKKNKGEVFLEGCVEMDGGEEVQKLQGVSRTRSLTGEDLNELKGCLDLGFAFTYEEIPVLCNTLPALELCYSMSQRFLDEQHRSPEASAASDALAMESSSLASPIANWKISSPGDNPEDVKARLKFWAQAVACTVRLCS